MRFRLTLHDTDNENKYSASSKYELFGDRDAIWYLLYTFAKLQNKKHVEVFNLAWHKQDPEKGLHAMSDYSI